MGSPCRFLRPAFPLLLFCLPGALAAAQQPEPSHQERFASPQDKLRAQEAKADDRLRENPQDAKALVERGLARLRMGKEAEALADLKRAVELDPALADAHASLAYAFMLQGHWPEGIAASRAALKIEPQHAGANYYLGHMLLQSGGDLAEAVQHLEKAAERSPEDLEIQFELFMAYRQAKDAAKAALQLRVLKTALPPNHPSLFYAEGLLAADLGNLQPAIGSFRRALGANPGLDLVRQDLGMALVQAGAWKEAADVFAPLAKSQPRSFTVAYFHALALQNAKQSVEAEAEVRRAIALNSNSADAAALLGIVLSSRGDYPGGAAALERAARLDAQNFDAQFYLGRARYALGDMAKSRAAFEAALALRPDDREVRFFLATVLEALGEKDAAVAQYRELTRQGPNDSRGFVGLGVILAKYGETQEALAALRRAHELAPRNYEANLALGRVLVQSGPLDEGLSFLRDAVQEMPGSPEAHYQLGLALRRAGKTAEAQHEFATVQRLNREHRQGSGMGAPDVRPLER